MGRRGQLAFRFRTRGGARRGAGRPPKGARAGVSHQRRPALSRHHPVHVTLRVAHGLPSLRERALFVAVREALAAGKERFGFRLVCFSVQRDHLHLLTEAEDRGAFTRGMQGLCIRVARAVNRQTARRGRVFSDRFHQHILKTPRTVRFALRYVLLNARKHGVGAPPAGFVDTCSSAPWFDGFARPPELAFGANGERAAWALSGHVLPPVAEPRSWLLRVGYLRAGPFDCDDVLASA